VDDGQGGDGQLQLQRIVEDGDDGRGQGRQIEKEAGKEDGRGKEISAHGHVVPKVEERIRVVAEMAGIKRR